jgi:hypothetical protein
VRAIAKACERHTGREAAKAKARLLEWPETHRPMSDRMAICAKNVSESKRASQRFAPSLGKEMTKESRRLTNQTPESK